MPLLTPFAPILPGAAGGIEFVQKSGVITAGSSSGTRNISGIDIGDPFLGRLVFAVCCFTHTGNKRNIYTIQFDDGGGFVDGFLVERPVNNEDATIGFGARIIDVGSTVDLRITHESGASQWAVELLTFRGVESAVALETQEASSTGAPSLIGDKRKGQLHVLGAQSRVGNDTPQVFTNFTQPISQTTHSSMNANWSYEIGEADEDAVVMSAEDRGQNALIYARLA